MPETCLPSIVDGSGAQRYIALAIRGPSPFYQLLLFRVPLTIARDCRRLYCLKISFTQSTCKNSRSVTIGEPDTDGQGFQASSQIIGQNWVDRSTAPTFLLHAGEAPSDATTASSGYRLFICLYPTQVQATICVYAHDKVSSVFASLP